MVQAALEESVLQATQVMEEQLDAKIKELENMDEDSLEGVRRKRLLQLRDKAKQEAEWRAAGHGEYFEINSEKAFFEEAKKSKAMVCHFYRPSTFRCKIFDRHLAALAKRHLECKFVKIDAEKSPFLTERLQVMVLPSLVLCQNGKVVEQVVGFTELGGVDSFPTEILAMRLHKVIKYEENEDYTPYGGVSAQQFAQEEEFDSDEFD